MIPHHFNPVSVWPRLSANFTEDCGSSPTGVLRARADIVTSMFWIITQKTQDWPLWKGPRKMEYLLSKNVSSVCGVLCIDRLPLKHSSKDLQYQSNRGTMCSTLNGLVEPVLCGLCDMVKQLPFNRDCKENIINSAIQQLTDVLQAVEVDDLRGTWLRIAATTMGTWA